MQAQDLISSSENAPGDGTRPPRVGRWSLATHMLWGADIFISYRRHEARGYALELRRLLEEKGYRCFLDEALLPMGQDIERYKQAARKSRMFVLLGSPTVFDSIHIPNELAAYVEGHRGRLSKRWMRILPVSVGDTLKKVESPSAKEDLKGLPWEPLAGLVCESEAPSALEQGKPSRSVVDRIEQSFTLVRSAVLMLVGAALAAALIFAATLGVIGVTVWFADERVKAANQSLERINGKLAETQGRYDSANAALGELNGKVQQAADELAAAKDQIGKANAEAESAQKKAAEAEAARVAEQARAEQQGAIADSRAFANRSQALLQRRPEALQRGIGLAVDAVAKAAARGISTAESDMALRESLSLLPHYLKGYSFKGDITDTALSPDARHFATLDEDDVLRVYTVGDSAPPKKFIFKGWRIAGRVGGRIAISGGASYVAVASNDTVRVYKLRSGGPGDSSETYELKTADSRAIKVDKERAEDEDLEVGIERIALSPGGKYLALIKSVENWSSQGGLLDVRAGLNQASVWDVESGVEIQTLPGGERYHAISFSAGGDLAVGAGVRLRNEFSGFTGMVSLWPLSKKIKGDEAANKLSREDFAQVETYPLKDEVTAVASGPDAMYFATNSAILRRNDVGAFTAFARLPFKEGDPLYISDLAFTPDGKRLAVVRRMPPPTGAQEERFGADRKVEMWDTAEHPDAAHVFLPGKAAGVGFLHGKGLIAAASFYDRAGIQRVFDVQGGAEVKPPAATGEGEATRPEVYFVSRDARFTVSATEDAVYVRDVLRSRTIAVSRRREFKDGRGFQVALSANGEFLAVTGARPDAETGAAIIYKLDGDSYREEHRLDLTGVRPGELGSFNRVTTRPRLAVTPDGRRLVTLAGNVARVWDVLAAREDTPKALGALSQSDDNNEVNLFELSKGGRYLAVAYDDGEPVEDDADEDEVRSTKPANVMVIRLSDGSVVGRVACAGQISSMVFSQRERLMLTSGHDKNMYLTDLNTRHTSRLARADSVVQAAAFSADDRYFALGSGDGTRVFATDEPQTEIAFLRDTGAVTAVAFSEDGALLATLSERESTRYQTRAENHPLRVWRVRPGDLLDEAGNRLKSIPSYLREDSIVAKASAAAAAARTKERRRVPLTFKTRRRP